MSKRILVVEDDRYLTEIYRRALVEEGYKVSCAYDGEEGIKVFKAIPQPDLIVLDLKMPQMTGDEFIKVLRRNNLLKDTKVLVLSSVLYHYKPIPGYEDCAGVFGGHTYMKQDGLTKLGKKAEEAGLTEMQEKPEQLAKPTGFGTEMEAESQAEFEYNVSQNLLRRVKALFGEPYVEKKRERGLIPHTPTTLIPARVIELVAECLKIDKEKLSSTTDFDKDLKVCYISQRALRRRINKEFNVKVSFWSHREVETVGDLIDAVEYTKQFDAYERKRINKKFWEDWKPIVIVGIILPSIIGLVMLIWELVIKRYFLR